MRLLLLLAAVLGLAACSEDDGNEAAPARPGFAIAGAVQTNYNIHIYRTTLPPRSGRGLVVRFHPRTGSSLRFQDDVRPPTEELTMCEQEVGAGGRRISGSCRTVRIRSEFDIAADGMSHLAVELLAPGGDPVFIPEVVVGYDPADAFLAIEVPA